MDGLLRSSEKLSEENARKKTRDLPVSKACWWEKETTC